MKLGGVPDGFICAVGTEVGFCLVRWSEIALALSATQKLLILAPTMRIGEPVSGAQPARQKCLPLIQKSLE
jgi:hypothetical protein